MDNYFRWTCPKCEAENEAEAQDAAMHAQTCDCCGKEFTISFSVEVNEVEPA